MELFRIWLLWCVVCAHAAPPCFRANAARLLRRLRLSPARLADVRTVRADLERALRTRWTQTSVTPFGSTVAGLGIRDSDVDCHAQLPGPYHDNLIYEVKTLLDQFPHLFHRPTVVVPATRPHVRLVHIATSLQCDVSFNNREAVDETALMKYYMNRDERILDLATLVKYWAKTHKPKNYRRIMPNYAVITLVIFYLQQINMLLPVAALQESTRSKEQWNALFDEVAHYPTNNETLYNLLAGFFQYYSQFDFEKNVVSPYAGMPIKRSDFEKVSTLPKVFRLYEENVYKNKVHSLNLTAPILIQNPFIHNRNVAHDTTKEVLEQFKSDLKFAGRKFSEDREDILKVILNNDKLLHTENIFSQNEQLNFSAISSCDVCSKYCC